CRFGRPCGVILTDITEEGLNQHLAQYHLQDLQDSHETSSGKVACFWDVGGRPCGKAVVVDGLAKHLASAHLGIMRKGCQYCGASLARIDALLRHQRRDC
ncbi:hypothetical protein FOMPIDRAFT_1098897, partial [Fomitopsis schrenkii]